MYIYYFAASAAAFAASAAFFKFGTDVGHVTGVQAPLGPKSATRLTK